MSSQRLKYGALLLAAWTLFGVMSSAHFFVREEVAANGGSFRNMLTTIVVFYWIWALVTPAAIAVARRAVRSGWQGWVLAALVAPLLVVLQGVIYLSVAGLFGADASGSLGMESLRKHLVRHGSGGLATVAMIYGVYLFLDAHRRMREREVAAAELTSRLVQTDLEVLRWQLHPHFLFNVLNTVSTLVLRGAAQEAESAIAQISRYLRSALSQRADSVVSLAQELAVVQEYVDIERLRFGDALCVQQQISDDALSSRVPSLILQPLVENAIRFGGPGATRKGAIVIKGETVGRRLLLSVIDPGDGRGIASNEGAADSQQEGFGLKYVQQRLRHFYADDAVLRLERAPGKTIVTIDVPLIAEARS